MLTSSLRTPGRLVLAGMLLAAPSHAVFAQAPSSGPTSTVVYAGGNDLVLKASDGKLLNFTVPASTKFSVGDKTLSLAELKPGVKLTKPVSTGFDPKIVTGVKVVKGKVYAATPPDAVTLSLAEGTKELVVPTGTTFMVDGTAMTVSQLKPNMMVEATIVTTGADGAPAPAAAPETPKMAGALLVAVTAGGDADLPAAGTSLPLFGGLGVLCLALGAGILTFRKRVEAN